LFVSAPRTKIPPAPLLSMDRRQALLEWAGRSDTLIWEHDFDSQYFYDNKRLPALQGYGSKRSGYIFRLVLGDHGADGEAGLFGRA
jgi:GntR family transcriptional regulator/MocR family aminotransferase